MAFPVNPYAPPSVYTTTSFVNPLSATLEALKIPIIVGEGNQNLQQTNLEVIRGSSSTSDTLVTLEDEAGQAVVSISNAGQVTVGDFNGVLTTFQVHNFPVVTGDGSHTVSNNRNDVSVYVNNTPVVVQSLVGATGLVQLVTPPNAGDLVQCTYYFDRSDTLITDNVSDQVPNTLAVIQALAGLPTGQVINLYANTVVNGIVTVPNNNVLILVVDGVTQTITIPVRNNYTMAQVALAINGSHAGSLVASTFVNNVGETALQLTATSSLSIGAGSANGPLYLQSGQANNRVTTFYTFNGPITDGSGGGVTTTDPSNVTVKVNGKQVIPVAVDGTTRAVTLAVAPAAGAVVSIQYYFNTWQDTFDYLANVGITSILQCGNTQGQSDYVQDADFILQNNEVVWGTAATVNSGLNTSGFTVFGSNQINLTLVDNRNFLGLCAPLVTLSGGVATESYTQFTLPLQPTLGNGRDTPLGQSLFQTVSNGRIDLPTNRPDVVWAYVGWNPQDALNKGQVEVIEVEGIVATLAQPIEVGQNVYVTQYYNEIADQTFTVSCLTAGTSGNGTYNVTNAQGDSYLGCTLGNIGSGLTGVNIEFPGGSQLTPDFRFENPINSAETTQFFTGPVEEVVTVTFASTPASPGRYTFPGAAPYFTNFFSLSETLSINVQGIAVSVNLANPSADGFNGPMAYLVGNEVSYPSTIGGTTGLNFVLPAPDQLVLQVDGTTVPVTVPVNSTPATIAWYAQWINEAASGHQALSGSAGSTTTIVLGGANAAAPNGYYDGWNIVIGYDSTNLTLTGGQVAVVSNYVASTKTATVTSAFAGGGSAQASTPYYIYNPLTQSQLTASTIFDAPVSIGSNHFDRLTLKYVGNNNGATNAIVVDLTGTHATANALASYLTTTINSTITGFVTNPFKGLAVNVTANTSGQLQFALQLPGTDSSGFIQFISQAFASTARDFTLLAGLDADTTIGIGQTALVQGPIATQYVPNVTSVPNSYDRLILRNRVLPSQFGHFSTTDDVATANSWSVAPTEALVVSTGSVQAGLTAGAFGSDDIAVQRPAIATGRVTLVNGQNATTFQPQVTFYDGSGTAPANNVLNLILGSQSVTVTFAASGGGTATDLGPIQTAGTIMYQLQLQIGAAVSNSFTLNQTGASFQIIYSQVNDRQAKVQVNPGSANTALLLQQGTYYLGQVSAEAMASALMSNANNTDTLPTSWLLNIASTTTNKFAYYGIATTVTDNTGAQYLYVQATPISSGLGTSSNVTVLACSALDFGSGLNAQPGDGGVGDNGNQGFYVLSNNSSGSGTINNSILNPGSVTYPDGTGQDGVIGQTYRDEVTGLTFTVLPRGWSANPAGPWTPYPTGVNAAFQIVVTPNIICNANIPTLAIPGVEMTVANTAGVNVGDTAIVTTFEASGTQPHIGDSYYVTYVYTKQDYTTAFYTKISALQNAYGPAIPDNPVSLGGYLAMINGAVLIGVTQVLTAPGSTQASLATYAQAISDLEGPLPGQVQPDMITLMRGDSIDLYEILEQSNNLMSSVRYKSERTSILGLSAGSLPALAITDAGTLMNTRMRLVYPDVYTITIQDNLGNSQDYLIDGTYAACALTGSVSSPNVDVATPWTGRKLVGFNQTARVLDMVTQNQIASNGVTILEDKPPYLRVRHGLTTDMTNILTKLPTIILISDEIQRQARNTLDNFIGIKFLPGVLSQIEGQLSMMLKANVSANIITAYTGVTANVDPNDPTTADVAAAYSPVFPLLYIIVNFSLQSSL